jgi:sugar/nucleoside kinase (ribokinase family)
MNPQIAIVGSATRDRIVHGQDSHLKWGGVVVYSGLTLSRLGINTAISTNIADCDSALVELLNNAGISTDAGKTDVTTEFVNHVSGDSRDQELLASATPICAQQLSRITASTDHIYLGPLHPVDIEPTALATLKDVHRVSVDIQGYSRRIRDGKVHKEVSEHLPLCLECADVVKASCDETEAVEAFFGQSLGAIMAQFGIDQWLTTDGENGGWLLDHATGRHDFDVVPVADVKDSTGAGDVFFAAYLTHYVYRDAGIHEALRRAAAHAASQVGGQFITADELSRDAD